MRTRLLSMLGLTLLFAACSKDDNTSPDNGNEPTVQDTLYVSSVTSSTNDKGGFSRDSTVFGYNSDKMLKRYVYISFYEYGGDWTGYAYFFHYENKRLKDTYVNSGGMSDLNTWVADTVGRPKYIITNVNSRGQVTRMIPATGEADFDTLIYNGQGQLIEKYHIAPTISTTLPTTRVTLTYENNNVTKVIEVNNYPGIPTRTDTTTYKYDNKPNAYWAAAPLVLEQYDSFNYLSANNPVEEVNVYDGYITTTTYQYQYNDKGYPVSYTTLRKEIDRGSPIATVNTEYHITYLPQ